MHHYIDIHLLPDAEIAPHQLMSHLFNRVHGRLARGQFDQVAVSFPGYALTPAMVGTTLRLIAARSELEVFMAENWLGALSDHVRITQIQLVPANAQHCQLKRVQAKSSPERLRRRQMKRHGLTAEQAKAQVPDHCAERLALPFLTLASSTTGQQFRMFLQRSPALDSALPGRFNAYGLSAEATTPWF